VVGKYYIAFVANAVLFAVVKEFKNWFRSVLGYLF